MCPKIPIVFITLFLTYKGTSEPHVPAYEDIAIKANKQIKVLTYNLHKGMDSLGRKNVLTPIKRALSTVDADFVFLQEVMGTSKHKKHAIKEWNGAAQFEYLADKLWSHYAYAKNAVFSDRHHGNAILSRFPIVSYENIDISTNRLEKRGLLHAVAHDPVNDRYFELLCVHIDLAERGRQQQIKKIAARISSAVVPGRPLLMCGDFNDWRSQTAKNIDRTMHFGEAFRHLHGKFARSFPSFAPVLPLDRLYYRNLQAEAALVLSGSPWNKLSDHLPLHGTFGVKS